MIEATLADLRQSNLVNGWNDVVHLTDARKKTEVGYFIPIQLSDEFKEFMQQRVQQQKVNLLQRIAKAQQQDPIEEGALYDNLS
jgi:hypothetical protein